ncbi:MAG: transposase [Gelidibacter sp.]
MKNRKRNRLKGYDYSSDNLYFVTICVQNMVCCLGEITVHDRDKSKENQSNQKMILNPYGLIVQNRLEWLENQYPYIIIHNYVVMPNHVHAVIEIDRSKIKDIGIKIKSLSSLVGAFKTTSSKLIHEKGFIDFAWQRSFHDHIVRKDSTFQTIMNYIDMNPQKWNYDKFFKKH